MAVRRVQQRLRHEPLWRRVERNRLRVALFMAGFVAVSAVAAVVMVMPAAWLLSLAVLAAVGEVASDAGSGAVGEAAYLAASAIFDYPGLFALVTGGIGALAGAAHLRHTLTRPLRAQLCAMGAEWVPFDEMRTTREALKDMAIASGVTDPRPDLFVLDSTGVNAFLIARGGQQPLAVVTTALAKRFDADEQRAVFANLMARYLAGDVHWATAVSAVMSPLWRWRDRDLSGDDDLPLLRGSKRAYLAADRRGALYVTTSVKIAADKDVMPAAMLLTGAPFGLAAYAVAVVVSELVMFGHRVSQLIAAEKADAEGMLLLKDPRVMLRTLRKAVEADNRVRLGVPMYAGLFYIWAGDDVAGDDDPEWERVSRLREVVGVDGIADAHEDAERVVAESIALASVLPPPAPRLEREAEAAGRARDLETLRAERSIIRTASGEYRRAPAWGESRPGSFERLATVGLAVAVLALPLAVALVGGGLAKEPGAQLALAAPFIAGGLTLLMGEAWVGGLLGVAVLLVGRQVLAAGGATGSEFLMLALFETCLAAIGGALYGAQVRDTFSDLIRKRP